MVEYTGKFEVSKSAPGAWSVYAVRVGGAWECVGIYTSKKAAMDEKKCREGAAAPALAEKYRQRAAEHAALIADFTR
jgi:hypothetical protein